MTVGLNRARMTTSTTGTGTITLGSAVTGYASLDEAGAVNATAYTYCIEDGDDFEIGTGTYTSSGTTLSRDTVTLSKISGTAGTSKINLSGSAKVFITIKADDIQPSTAIGLVLLNSGSVSTAATLDISLVGLTSYRAFKIVLTSFIPATNDVELWCRFSTDGGSTFATTGYIYYCRGNASDTGSRIRGSTSDSKIIVIGGSAANDAISNTAAHGGCDVEMTVFDPLDTTRYSRVTWGAVGIETDPQLIEVHGSGTKSTAQDTDAIRFLFESGNIASGDWALYGFI